MRDFSGTFRVLRALLEPYVPRLHVSHDSPTLYMLEGEFVEEFKRVMPFAGVQARRSCVTFVLLPVYSHPELLSRTSDGLRKRLRDKSGFDFTSPERELLVELSALVEAGFALYEGLGWVK
jgi:hypothetical protein